MVLLPELLRLPEIFTPEPFIPEPFTVVLVSVLLPLVDTPEPLPVALPVMLPSVTLPLMLTPLPSPEAVPVMVLLPELLRLMLVLTPEPFTDEPLRLLFIRLTLSFLGFALSWPICSSLTPE